MTPVCNLNMQGFKLSLPSDQALSWTLSLIIKFDLRTFLNIPAGEVRPDRLVVGPFTCRIGLLTCERGPGKGVSIGWGVAMTGNMGSFFFVCALHFCSKKYNETRAGRVHIGC